MPIPHKMDKFWASGVNKQNLQLLTRDMGERDHAGRGSEWNGCQGGANICKIKAEWITC